ncbi:hypothetical protein ACRAWD_04375 [Caulobacter segnis]
MIQARIATEPHVGVAVSNGRRDTVISGDAAHAQSGSAGRAGGRGRPMRPDRGHGVDIAPNWIR